MGAVDMTGAHVHRRCADLIHLQLIHQYADANHIRHCIHCANFMEMNLLHRHSVGLAFRLGNGLIDTQRVIPHRLGQGQVGHNVGDIRMLVWW